MDQWNWSASQLGYTGAGAKGYPAQRASQKSERKSKTITIEITLQ